MKDKVLVAMSGGVDSSVALLKIIDMGYDAIGITMKLWEYRDVGGNLLEDSNCCSVGAINNAKLVCDRLNVPHYTIDFTDVFRETVVDNFADEYLKGRTPNPCVRCNSFVKWDAFIDQADQFGAKYIATGHYARIGFNQGHFSLHKGVDPLKDQSYVLWGIPPETLARTLLPLGDLTKKDVRKIAAENDLATANSPESMEICFVADNNYKKFIQNYAPSRMNAVEHGDILQDDIIVGKHSGYIGYTIGQRKGIGVTYSEPRYVKSIDAETNTITISKKDGLFQDRCRISNMNWLLDKPDFSIPIEFMIRYNSPTVKGRLYESSNVTWAEFDTPHLSVTPGQSIVFYRGDQVLGGGIIEKSVKDSC